MASSLLRSLRKALSRRTIATRTAARQKFRLRLEALETRVMMHDGGTLGDEHAAVMQLVNFEYIHSPAPDVTMPKTDFAVTSYFYRAKDVDADANNNFHWSDLDNWVVETYDPAKTTDPNKPQFSESPALHLPANGDDVDIPVGVSLLYDLGTAPFAMPGSPQDAPKVSVKNDLRLHSVGVGGALTFQPNSDLLMYFETLVVKPTVEGVPASGVLTMDEKVGGSVRLVIAAPDWQNFSLAHPFDTQLDPFEFARGLISHGHVSIEGENVTPYVTVPALTKAANVFDASAVIPTSTASPAAASTPNTAAKKPTAPTPNAFQFTVDSGQPFGWTVGDRIVVTGTDASKVNSSTGGSGDEEAVITNIKLDSKSGAATIIARVEISTATASNPLSAPDKLQGYLHFDHSSPFGVQITNLTRNINIQSEDPYHTMARGHTMFMHSADVNIAGVGLLGLGRSDKRTVVDDSQLYTKEIIDALNQATLLQDKSATVANGKLISDKMINHFIPGTGLNPRGRYAIHFHRAGINETDADKGADPNHPVLTAATPAEVKDSVVVDSPGWGYVNHSGYVNFDNNVAFNVVGDSFVTEAGNQLGRFTGNLAIKGVGADTGEGIESRKVKQDFGFQGDGFWFQGASIQVEDNIAVSQHHDGFVFFTQPLVQNYKWAPDPNDDDTFVTARQAASTTTDILAKFYSPALIAAFGGTGKSVDPGNVPILSFKNNTAVADAVGMETWFHQLGSPLNPSTQRDLGSQVDGLRVSNTRGTGMFDPYTNLLTVKNTQLIGNLTSPGGTGMGRNDVTTNLTYDNDSIRGFGLGVAIPVNGTDKVLGGTYLNKRNFEITTANSQTRTVWFSDKIDASGAIVSPLTTPAFSDANLEKTRLNIDLRTNYDPKERDLSKLFNPDLIRMGTVWLNNFAMTQGKGQVQLYYFEQAAGFVPFPAGKDYGGAVIDNPQFKNIIDYTGIEVPSALLGKNNSELSAGFGLAIGGAVAPADAQDGRGTLTAEGNPDPASPRINGLIGSFSKYQPSLDATSARYTKAVDQSPDGLSSPQYTFSYRFAKPNVDDKGNPILEASGNQGVTNTNVTVQVGNFIPVSGFFQIDKSAVDANGNLATTTFTVNGKTVTLPTPPTGPLPTTTPVVQKLPSKPTPPTLPKKPTTAQTNAYNAAVSIYNADLSAYNAVVAANTVATSWIKYFKTPLQLSLNQGWNLVTGNLDGTSSKSPDGTTNPDGSPKMVPNMRTQLIYGDVVAPDLNITSPDKAQLRRLTTTDPNNPWAAGTWDATLQKMTGVALGGAPGSVGTTTVTGQLVGVMNPDDLSFGFALKGQIVDQSFGHKSFEMFVNNLPNYLDATDPSKKVPFLTPPIDPTLQTPLANYADASGASKILSYQSFKDPKQPQVFVAQHLQTIFFSVKDTAGNSKTFALTIYLDPTAPRVGGSANPTGSVVPSTSMVALANQEYLIDAATFLMIDATKKK